MCFSKSRILQKYINFLKIELFLRKEILKSKKILLYLPTTEIFKK